VFGARGASARAIDVRNRSNPTTVSAFSGT